MLIPYLFRKGHKDWGNVTGFKIDVQHVSLAMFQVDIIQNQTKKRMPWTICISKRVKYNSYTYQYIYNVSHIHFRVLLPTRKHICLRDITLKTQQPNVCHYTKRAENKNTMLITRRKRQHTLNTNGK